MRMRYPRHLNIGPADSPEGRCELVKWCQCLSAVLKVIRFYLRIIQGVSQLLKQSDWAQIQDFK